MKELFSQDPKKWDPETRKRAQIDIKTTARYFCPSQRKETEIAALVTDISEGGVSLVTDKKKIPSKVEVHFSFCLPALAVAKDIHVTGRVNRTESCEGDKYRSGIEFTAISAEARTAIRNFISSRQLGEFF